MESTLSLFAVTLTRIRQPKSAVRRNPAGLFRQEPESGAPPTYFGFTETEAKSERRQSAGNLEFAGSRRAARIAALVLVIGLPSLVTPAVAVDHSELPAPPPPQKWQIELGLGVAAVPKYPGSGQISALPLPLVSVTYDETFFVSSLQGIGAYLIRTPNFKLGASIGIAADTRYTGKDARLRGLPKIKPGGLASLFAAYELGPVTVEAAAHERIGTANGVSATLGATYRIRLTSDWSMTAGPQLRVLSAHLNDAYFGVTPADSLRAASYGNRISPYKPGTGIEVVPITIASRYRVSEHWTLMARAGLGVLVGRDGDSPLTRERLQPEIGLSAAYRF
jgi:outer membrane scaffolding protein for murein synthesis (MipA/OmpV family)